ncbi:DUF3578 domain-containing protein [Desulfovibrio subterraneus]|uniref:MrcB family domain-containing protein n=1 Tax=Desulfovibrio subterraneus TaxID=2718620 RepID=UPI0022B874EA|nr:DUF3578 domain-containing protein [Desulfovibrio subterraneus]WBF67406.1 DUF3578 domain-containing protein [Desulfovibrio subterraneus]
MLRDTFERIGKEYEAAIKGDYNGDVPIRKLIVKETPEKITQFLNSEFELLEAKGGCGNGKWSHVPGIAILDKTVTDSAQRGYFVTYLVCLNKGVVYLSLNQGATDLKDEFGKECSSILSSRAELMRKRLKDVAKKFPVDTISIERGALAKEYSAGHSLGFEYALDNLPSEEILQHDLVAICDAYAKLKFLGGVDTSYEPAGKGEGKDDTLLEEGRRKKAHERLERYGNNTARIKRALKCTCQACSFDFVKYYGAIGKNFIEVHHRHPYSDLKEGERRKPEIADFAVLCSNCHRMIHRMDDISDVEGLKKLIEEQRRKA